MRRGLERRLDTTIAGDPEVATATIGFELALSELVERLGEMGVDATRAEIDDQRGADRNVSGGRGCVGRLRDLDQNRCFELGRGGQRIEALDMNPITMNLSFQRL